MLEAPAKFMGSSDASLGAHWDHELGAGTARPRTVNGDEPSPSRFMESQGSIVHGAKRRTRNEDEKEDDSEPPQLPLTAPGFQLRWGFAWPFRDRRRQD